MEQSIHFGQLFEISFVVRDQENIIYIEQCGRQWMLGDLCEWYACNKNE